MMIETGIMVAQMSCQVFIFAQYSFKVHDNLCGSDHFLVILKNGSSTVMDSVPRWNFSKANWDLFQFQCVSKLYPDKLKDTDDPIDKLSSAI